MASYHFNSQHELQRSKFISLLFSLVCFIHFKVTSETAKYHPHPHPHHCDDQAFKLFDADGDGKINGEELKALVNKVSDNDDNGDNDADNNNNEDAHDVDDDDDDDDAEEKQLIF